MEDYESPPELPVALDVNGRPWENKPDVKIEKKINEMSLKNSERALIEGALAEHEWMKLIDRLHAATLSEDDQEKRDQIVKFIERNLIK